MNKLPHPTRELDVIDVIAEDLPITHSSRFPVSEKKARSLTLMLAFLIIAGLLLVNQLGADMAFLSALMFIGGLSAGFGVLIHKAFHNGLASLISAVAAGFALYASGVATSVIINIAHIFAAIQHVSGILALVVGVFFFAVLLREIF